MSSARRAQLGLVAVAVMFASSLGILGGKAVQRQMQPAASESKQVERPGDSSRGSGDLVATPLPAQWK